MRQRLVTCMAVALAVAASGAVAQERPADLAELPPVPTDYTPAKTAWGDWDFSHTYQIEYFNAGKILFQRPKEYGNRVWVTDEELARRQAAAERSDAAYSPEGQGINYPGSQGLGEWMRTSPFAKRTSLLVSPADGQLPALTPEGERLFRAGRSGWVPGQEYDWVTDFDTWDRCITRGFPTSMFPNRYNNGIRVWQSPGYVVIQNEMLGLRVIPIGDTPAWPGAVEQWMGHSRARWEGKTLVIETSNIQSGDAVTHDPNKRSAAPVIVTMIGGAPFNTIPMSARTRVTERLTMTGPDTLVHELTYDDPETFTAPWTTRIEWVRDDGYQFYEYACHEGNHAIRGYINSSRAKRRDEAAGIVQPQTLEQDDRSRFITIFDRDPGVAPPPAPPPAPAAPAAESGAGR
jgi:hypothetical protein